MTDNHERPNSMPKKTLVLALEFGFIIVLPLLLFGLLGKWLAAKYDNKIYLFAAIILAVLSSTIWLYRRLKAIFEDLKNK